MEDNLQVEEQIKKKKRVILLMLFTLLLITAMTAVLLEPTGSDSPEVVIVSPTQPATPIANIATSTATPSQIQGDEWVQPTPSSPANSEITLTAAAATQKVTQTVEATRRVDTPTRINTPIATKMVSEEGTEASVGSTPSSNGEVESTYPATITSTEGTAIAEGVPTTDPGTQAATSPVETSPEMTEDTSSSPDKPAEISQRINESWDTIHSSDTSEIAGSNTPLPTSSAILTHTNSLSETMAVAPPNGLPVTGTITPRGMNWAALAMVVLLLGVGVVALLSPQPEQK